MPQPSPAYSLHDIARSLARRDRCDDRDAGIDAQHVQRGPGALDPAAGRDGPRHAAIGEVRQQLAGAGQRPDLAHQPAVRLGVEALDAGDLLGGDRGAGLTQEGVDEQAAAHPDPAVDAPDGEVDPGLLQRLAPRQDMLVDADDERSIEIKDHGRISHC